MPAKKTTILTADDDPQLLRLVVRNLEFEDYNVLTASNGKQALERIEAYAPDAILLDVMMPQMDGFQVCQRVRRVFDGSHHPGHCTWTGSRQGAWVRSGSRRLPDQTL